MNRRRGDDEPMSSTTTRTPIIVSMSSSSSSFYRPIPSAASAAMSYAAFTRPISAAASSSSSSSAQPIASLIQPLLIPNNRVLRSHLHTMITTNLASIIAMVTAMRDVNGTLSQHAAAIRGTSITRACEVAAVQVQSIMSILSATTVVDIRSTSAIAHDIHRIDCVKLRAVYRDTIKHTLDSVAITKRLYEMNSQTHFNPSIDKLKAVQSKLLAVSSTIDAAVEQNNIGNRERFNDNRTEYIKSTVNLADIAALQRFAHSPSTPADQFLFELELCSEPTINMKQHIVELDIETAKMMAAPLQIDLYQEEPGDDEYSTYRFGSYDATDRITQITRMRNKAIVILRLISDRPQHRVTDYYGIDVNTEKTKMELCIRRLHVCERDTLVKLYSIKRTTRHAKLLCAHTQWMERENIIEAEMEMMRSQFNQEQHNESRINVTDFSADTLNNFAIVLKTQGHELIEKYMGSSDDVATKRRIWFITVNSKRRRPRSALAPPTLTYEGDEYQSTPMDCSVSVSASSLAMSTSSTSSSSSKRSHSASLSLSLSSSAPVFVFPSISSEAKRMRTDEQGEHPANIAAYKAMLDTMCTKATLNAVAVKSTYTNLRIGDLFMACAQLSTTDQLISAAAAFWEGVHKFISDVSSQHFKFVRRYGLHTRSAYLDDSSVGQLMRYQCILLYAHFLESCRLMTAIEKQYDRSKNSLPSLAANDETCERMTATMQLFNATQTMSDDLYYKHINSVPENDQDLNLIKTKASNSYALAEIEYVAKMDAFAMQMSELTVFRRATAWDERISNKSLDGARSATIEMQIDVRMITDLESQYSHVRDAVRSWTDNDKIEKARPQQIDNQQLLQKFDAYFVYLINIAQSMKYILVPHPSDARDSESDVAKRLFDALNGIGLATVDFVIGHAHASSPLYIKLYRTALVEPPPPENQIVSGYDRDDDDEDCDPPAELKLDISDDDN